MKSTILEKILEKAVFEKRQQQVPTPVVNNFLKEQIQYLILAIIYNNKLYKNMVFKGGSALRILYDLPRLSEDLDFDYNIKNFELENLEKVISYEFKTKYFPNLETKVQSNKRIYLKFPILKSLKLAGPSDSDKLYVKIEVGKTILPFAEMEITPISKFGVNFLARHYDLPTLMAGKIHALLNRIWFKGKTSEVDIKGRDFYDLYWFLSKDVKPNWKTLKSGINIADETQLKKEIKKRIETSVTPAKLSYDLNNFLSDPNFVREFSQNYPKIMDKFLKNLS